MRRTGAVNLPLHSGRAPAYLFRRMKLLAREISYYIVIEFGRDELLARLSDPFWFQAFGCVLGFDWHSSGVTTTVCGALKEALREAGREIGVFVAGGKGATSRKTPSEIETTCDRISLDASPLVYASRMSAKVDTAAVQDGYQIYHHTFFFTTDGKWCVVQQGMNEENGYARRYHWLSDRVESFVEEPHAAVCCDSKTPCLNMVARESADSRIASTELAKQHPEKLFSEIRRIQQLTMPARHHVELRDINPKYLHKILLKTYEASPEKFEDLLGMKGVGARTIRALSLIAELIYGAKPSFRDPARFSFAHGGKDGHPYPVDRQTYDRSIEFLKETVSKAKVSPVEKDKAVRRLRFFAQRLGIAK